jgi:hypothetical protein
MTPLKRTKGMSSIGDIVPVIQTVVPTKAGVPTVGRSLKIHVSGGVSGTD